MGKQIHNLFAPGKFFGNIFYNLNNFNHEFYPGRNIILQPIFTQ